ncbi:MAG: hypothetical protein ACRCW7_08040 [Cetobacterium sp.]
MATFSFNLRPSGVMPPSFSAIERSSKTDISYLGDERCLDPCLPK